MNYAYILKSRILDSMKKGLEMHVNPSKRGKRNRQRGAELQREVVKLAKEFGLDARNRDRGGAQFEKGDIEIEGEYFGCKRRETVASYLYPEKKEEGVFIRADRQKALVVLPVEYFLDLLAEYYYLYAKYIEYR